MSDLSKIINILNEKKNELDKSNNTLLEKIEFNHNCNLECEEVINDSYSGLKTSLKNYENYYKIKSISSLLLTLSFLSYYATSEDKLLYLSVFFLSIILLDDHFLKKEDLELTEYKCSIIYNLSFQKNIAKRDKNIKDEKEVLNYELRKINMALEFLNSLTEEESKKYLKLKI